MLARAYESGVDPDILLPYSQFMAREGDTLALLRRSAVKYSAYVVYPHEVLCDKKNCMVQKGRQSLYDDDHHLNLHGAMLLAPMIDKLFENRAPR